MDWPQIGVGEVGAGEGGAPAAAWFGNCLCRPMIPNEITKQATIARLSKRFFDRIMTFRNYYQLILPIAITVTRYRRNLFRNCFHDHTVLSADDHQ